MKNVLFVVLTVLFCTSCTKDWTCKCKSTVKIGESHSVTKSSYKINDKPRSEAKEICAASDIETSLVTNKCKL